MPPSDNFSWEPKSSGREAERQFYNVFEENFPLNLS